MKKLISIFIVVFLVLHSYGQCTNPSAYGNAVAPATVGTSATISTCNFQTEYSTISNIVSGNTYTATNSSGGCITIHSGTPGGPVVAFGNAPLTFTATSSGTYYFHYNTNCTTCGTATFCGTTSVSLLASGGSGGGGGTPCSQNTVVVNMFDSWGDGWNGASYSLINSSGLVVGSGTLSTGSSGSNSFCLPSGCYYMSVTSGTWPTEVSWNITVNGTAVSNGAANTINALVSVGSCSPPPAPPSLPGVNCNSATPFCTGTTYNFPAGVNQPAAPVGPAYGCLYSQPNPVWHFLQVQNPGQLDITLSNSSGADIDFILWGPFSSPFGACLAGLTSSTIVDCSYSGAATEYVNIPNAVTGQYYMLLVTNYSNTNTNFNFAQTSGNATTNCSILCNINAMTAIPGICNSPSNTFNVSGSISTYAPPTSGTLTITPSCGGTPLILYPPFLTTMNYTLTGVQATGGPCAITAQYSADPLCNFTTNITSPSPCTQCNATASNTGPYCIGSPIQLNSSGGGTYSWTGPNGFTSNLQNPTINNSSASPAGIYTVTVLNSGVTCTANTTVILNQPVTPIFAQVAAICSGGTFTLPSASINGIFGSWLPAINNTATTTYTFTPFNGQCSLPATYTVIVNPLPTAVSGGTQTICSNATATVSGASSSNGTILWTENGAGTITSGATTLTPVYTAASGDAGNTVTLTMTVTSTNACAPQTATATYTVIVNQQAVPTFAQIAAICSGGTFMLPATSINGIPGSWLPAINNTATTTYTFTPSVGQCALPATQTVTVNQPVTPTFAQVAAICSGGTFTLTATSINGIPGSWLPAINNTATTTYTFTPSVGQCALTATQTVMVNQPVTPTFAQVAAICSGGSFTLPATSINGIQGSWLPAINNTATTTYTFSPSVGQCALTATQTVMVSQPVTPTFAQVAAICSGETITLPATSINGIPGSWLPAINNTATTTYTFTPSVGQCAFITTQTISINQPIIPSFSADIIYGCAPLSVTFTNTTPNSINCIWTISDGTTLTGISAATNVFTADGCYDVTLSSTGLDGCISDFTESNLVCVEVSPFADFFTDNTILTQDDLDVNFINTSIGAVDFIWDFGDNSAINTEENPYHEYVFTETSYTIMLIATSSLGCIDTAYSSIEMAEQLLYFVPNTFTPDGDLKNNFFQPVFTSGFDPYNFNMLIFNRWGEILFETNNAAIGWDGTYNGNYVQDGVYTWKIEFKAKENDKKHFLSGHVNLFR